MPPQQRSPPALSTLDVLTTGAIEIKGRMPWSSNATFLVSLSADSDGDVEMDAVYKPYRGERPLWDFPDGLFLREVAAYLLSESLGWGIVPETVIREDGPLGRGSLQRFVPADFSQHYFTLLEEPAHHQALRRIAAYDVVANNADRKSGHCLLGEDGRIWGIDHGVCFHEEPKLRTVIWDFAGDEVAPELLDDVRRVGESPPQSLCDVLHPGEVEAMVDRCERLVRSGVLPRPRGERPYPWPLV